MATTLDPSSGGKGMRLKMPRPMFRLTIRAKKSSQRVRPAVSPRTAATADKAPRARAER